MICQTAPIQTDNNNMSCSFDQDDFCGYYDDSPGLVHWTRSKDTPGSPGKITHCQITYYSIHS